MMGFNQQPESVVPNADNTPVNAPPVAPGQVYTMPDRFHPQSYHSSNKPLIAAAVVLGLVIIGFAGYFGFTYWSRLQDEIIAQEQDKQRAMIDDLNTTPPPVTTLPTAPLVTTTTVATTTIATTTVATTTVATTTPVVTDLITPPRISADTDRDGLTDIEEGVVGSSVTDPDTDDDTYQDGIEINNNYSPIVAGSAAASKLSAAKFVTSTATDFVDSNFSTFIPTLWTINRLPANRQLTVTTQTGEIIKMTAKPNIQGLSPSAAILQAYPQLNIGQLTPITAGSLSGVVSPNGLNIYLTDTGRSTIYVVEYIKDAGVDMRYPALLMMMVKNIKMVQPAATQPLAPATSPAPATNTTTTNGQ